MRKKDKGPLATPPVEPTRESVGRRREKEKPVPPPDLWISAACFTASKIRSMESPTGSTKQAANCPRSVPAFISVGELGRNLKLVTRSEYSRARAATLALPPLKLPSWAAILAATRQNSSRGSS